MTSDDSHPTETIAEHSNALPARHAAMLASIMALLDAASDAGQTLSEIARILATGLADLCAFDLVTRDGQWRGAALAAQPPALATLAAENARLFPTVDGDATGPSRVCRTGAPLVIDPVTDADLHSLSKDHDHYKRLKRLNARAYLCAPLIDDFAPIGALTLLRTAKDQPFTKDDFGFIERLTPLLVAALVKIERLTLEAIAAAQATEGGLLNRAMLVSRDDALATFLDVTDETVLVTSLEGHIVYWNRAAELTYGWTRDEAIGHPARVLLRTELPEAPGRLLDILKRDGRWSGELVNVRRDGTRVICASRQYLYNDSYGEPSAILEVALDITERHRAQMQLHEAYEREHKIAEALQRSMLVDIRNKQFDGVSIVPIYQAAWDEALVGGDFYDVFELRKGCVALIVGDVSGKGLAAAQYTAEVKFATRAYLCENEDPANALERLNRYAVRSLAMHERDPAMFVAMSIAIIEPAKGLVRLANAGMEPPMILRTCGTIEQIETSGKPIGLFDDECYEAPPVAISSGDTMLVVTDGVTEARHGATVLGYDGLMLLAKMANKQSSLTEMAETIMNDTRQFVGGKLHDDTCLVLARLT